jgi:phospholipase C
MMKKVTIRSATFPSCYLRIDGTGVTSFTGPGSGIVNCQSSAGEWEILMIENDLNSQTFAIRSTIFDNIYLRLDAEGFAQAAASGGGIVNC